MQQKLYLKSKNIIGGSYRVSNLVQLIVQETEKTVMKRNMHSEVRHG